MSSKIDEASKVAQWQSCYALAQFIENGDLRSMYSAAFHAGQAWAYYKAADMIHAPKPPKGSKTSEDRSE